MSDVIINSGTQEEVAYKLWQTLRTGNEGDDDALTLYQRCLNAVKGNRF